MAETVVRLSGFVLPQTSRHRRKHLLPPDRRDAAYLAGYDRRTLFYDCVRREQGDVLFTAPKFLNLWPVFRDALRVDGAPARGLRRHRLPKADIAILPDPAERLALALDGAEYPLAPRPSLAARFAGLNAVVTMNRNNRLDWIVDWLRFHVSAQGLTGAVIHDNGSTDYDLDALAARVEGIAGLQAVAVISAPYPYGVGIHRKHSRVSPKFLQSAMLNLARLETLSRARAVLNADIDELVVSTGERTVFDAAVARRQVPVKIGGHYVFPGDALGPDGIAQAAHVYREADPQPANRKWCIAPAAWINRFGWSVHRLGGEIFSLLPNDAHHHLLHCAATTTNWKGGLRHRVPAELERDPTLVHLMETHLAGAAREPAT